MLNIENLKESLDKFINALGKNVKILSQDLQNKKANDEQLKNLIINMMNGNESALLNTPYVRELEQIEKQSEKIQKNKNFEDKIKEEIPDEDKQKLALEIWKAYQNADNAATKLKGNSKDLEEIFTKSITNMINSTDDFGTSMKKLMNDLKNYFIKTITQAVLNGVINSKIGQHALSIFNGMTDFTENNVSSGLDFMFDALTSLFKHHSGGLIAHGTGTLPGTAEYLSILKGGERVLSPAENVQYEANSQKQNVVFNNFNVQAWDAKSVQQYLLENKNILAGITAENIKYNNANLRYIIGGG